MLVPPGAPPSHTQPHILVPYIALISQLVTSPSPTHHTTRQGLPSIASMPGEVLLSFDWPAPLLSLDAIPHPLLGKSNPVAFLFLPVIIDLSVLPLHTPSSIAQAQPAPIYWKVFAPWVPMAFPWTGLAFGIHLLTIGTNLVSVLLTSLKTFRLPNS